MLEYKVRVKDKTKEIKEIEFYDLFISKDKSVISGVTYQRYGLHQNDTLFLGYNGDETDLKEVAVSIKNAKRQGYLIEQVRYNCENLSYNGQIFKGIRYDDGRYYLQDFYDELDENGNYELAEPYTITIYVDGNETTYPIMHDSSTNEDYVLIDKKRWVYDETVMYGGSEYNVDYPTEDLNNGIPFILLNDEENNNKINIIDYQPEYFEYVTIFTIGKPKDETLIVENILCVEDFPYIYYGGDVTYQKNDETQNIIAKQTNRVYLQYDENGQLYFDDNGTVVTSDDNFTIEIQGNEFSIKHEWRNSTYSANYLSLYVDDTSIVFNEGDNIIASSINKIDKKCYVEEIVNDDDLTEYKVKFNGNYYDINLSEFIPLILIDNTPYEVIIDKYDNNEYVGYFQYNGTQQYVKFQYDNAETLEPQIINGELYSFANDSEPLTYEIVIEKFVVIKNEKYFILSEENVLIDDNERLNRYFVIVNDFEEYELNVLEVANGNVLKCYVVGDTSAYNLVINRDNYIFKLKNTLWDDVNDDFSMAIGGITSYDDIHLYKMNEYWKFTLPFFNNGGNELIQDENLKRYIEIKKDEATNSIIDMEKDIYYPAFYSSENNLEELRSMEFRLHFRTRDMTSWEISPDKSWNIFEATYSGKTIDKFYQPSDLLYYLGFDDDDVFYRKKSLSKSFIRLLFYDSDDTRNQSLLATSTIWFDSESAYRKYIQNQKTERNTSDRYQNVAYNEKSSMLSTNNELTINDDNDDDDDDFAFNEEKRLDATFKVYSKGFSTTSSEGFYLYLFKNYSYNLHERRIYMKIQFNHAGKGKTLNMFIPSFDSNVEINSFNDFKDAIKDGIELQKLYESTYIPVNVKYDDEKRKYFYYLPYDYSKNLSEEDKSNKNMIFNLYEIKIKNETDDA